MKKLVIFVVIAVALHFITRFALGFSIYRVADALEVSASLGAKIACSARYVSGFSQQQAQDDLASYSVATRLLEMNYDDGAKMVTANMLDVAEYSASYREGLGCTLNIGDTTGLDDLSVTEIKTENKAWPMGEQVANIVPEYQELTDKLLLQDNAEGLQTRALLVVKNGQVVAESYVDGTTPQTPLLGWSMAKSVTGMMFARMQQMGLADINAPTGFEEWQTDERREITLKHLMHMSSGLEFDETYAPNTDATNMLFHAHSAGEVALTARAGELPGEHFYYSSGTSNILMAWMQKQLGGPQALLDFYQQQLAQPLGLAHSVFEVDPSGMLVGSSYFFASARDWGKLGLLMLQGGQFNGEQLLDSDWAVNANKPNNSKNYQKYGYQFWLNSDSQESRWPAIPEDAYMMMGNRKQIVMIVPSENMIIVRLGWTTGSYPTEENFKHFFTL